MNLISLGIRFPTALCKVLFGHLGKGSEVGTQGSALDNQVIEFALKLLVELLASWSDMRSPIEETVNGELQEGCQPRDGQWGGAFRLDMPIAPPRTRRLALAACVTTVTARPPDPHSGLLSPLVWVHPFLLSLCIH